MIKHILEPVEDRGEEIAFVNHINDITGRITDAQNQAEDWDHVRHITGNLYYAWDEENPQVGAVYLGELV